jgi:hypothetical protein
MIGASPSREALDVRLLGVAELVDGSVENLLATYHERDGLFPYSTRLVDGVFVNDYETAGALRYTINSLLGLAEASEAGAGPAKRSDVATMVDTFLERQLPRVEGAGDLGLLAVLAVEQLEAEEIARNAIDRLRRTVASSGSDLDLQSLCWTVWGAAAATRAGIGRAEQLARTTADLVAHRFVDGKTGIPRHNTSRYRRSIVSFGGLTYYLRALHELERTFGEDGPWADAFRLGVERALRLQGPRGEWPWMIDTRTGTSFDVYPVFSVHQDSMAMLFLLPALDAGQPGVPDAIRRSVAWGFGENELATPFYRFDPFFAMRSIERVERAPRARRYARALRHRLPGARPAAFGRGNVRLNPECRSYHLGWILYVWSRRVATSAAAERE